MKLSKKYKRFLKYMDAEVEVLEGTTSSGKTTTGIPKAFFMIAKSDMKQHILSGETQGIIEKNIINADLGLLDVFGDYLQYYPNGSAGENLPHLLYTLDNGTKHIIYVVGYANANKWKYALGGQYGVGIIDEANTANIDFVRELQMRCRYTLMTLNPDDPEKEIYTEYINRCRPVEEIPSYMMEELNQPPESKWIYWFFSFDDNAGISKERIEQIKRSAPVGSRLYKTKIEGIRTKGVGLVYEGFGKDNIITYEKAKTYTYKRFSYGIDTSYSQQSTDTFAFEFIGITNTGKLVVLEEMVFNNKDRGVTPSDIPGIFDAFHKQCTNEWGFTRDVFVDSADQATISELKKIPKTYNIINSYKKFKILDRVNAKLGWIARGYYEVVESNKHHIKELNSQAWDKDAPEDRNNHTIDATDYAWIPFKHEIGVR